jgi:hypothetical protein
MMTLTCDRTPTTTQMKVQGIPSRHPHDTFSSFHYSVPYPICPFLLSHYDLRLATTPHDCTVPHLVDHFVSSNLHILDHRVLDLSRHACLLRYKMQIQKSDHTLRSGSRHVICLLFFDSRIARTFERRTSEFLILQGSVVLTNDSVYKVVVCSQKA